MTINIDRFLSLNDVLAVGNETTGNNIIVSSGDVITSSGTGPLTLASDTQITGNLNVTNNLDVTNELTTSWINVGATTSADAPAKLAVGNGSVRDFLITDRAGGGNGNQIMLTGTGDFHQIYSHDHLFIAADRDINGDHNSGFRRLQLEAGPATAAAARIEIRAPGSTTPPFGNQRIFILGGDAVGDGITPVTAGEILIEGGQAAGGGDEETGGRIRIFAGNSGASGTGASVEIRGGDNSGVASVGVAGDVVLLGGKGPFLNGQGGSISIRGGGANNPFPTGTTQIGGHITCIAGDGGSTAGNGGTLTLDAGASPAATAGDVDIGITNAINLRLGATATLIGFFGASPVGKRGPYTITNHAVDRIYDANATTVEELADVLGALILDLRDLGLLNASIS